MNKNYDYYHILADGRGGWTVKGYDTWPSHSVLAGQVRISFLASFSTIKEAEKAYPLAKLSHALSEPLNSFNHLSDEEGSY